MSSDIFQGNSNRDPFDDDFNSTMKWAVVGSVGKLTFIYFYS